MSVVASQLLHIFIKIARSSMWNSLESTPLTFLKNTLAHCTVSLDQELVGFPMVDALFNFTTKLFNTNPPKLWPINTI